MSRQADAETTVAITVDGKAIEARKGEMLIAAAERAGIYIPRFCWHPRMKPVGMCRMCLVEVKGPRGFALLPSCYVPVADGQEVVTTSDKVKKAQDGVLEFLLINHPLDCPVCDRGGECPLQDQTFAFGPGESRFVEEKRHWARCTRFADEIAGDPFIDFIGRADATEVNIFPDRPFMSNFSANIVQICPVGALTSTPYRFKARPWDLEVVESTCTACAVGCRVAVQSSSDRIIRNLGVDSDPVNQGWLCDKGRFGYEAANTDDRLTTPLVRRGEELVEATWSEALQAAADGLRQVRDTSGPQAMSVVGGARLANEDAYAWAKLAKGVLGTDNVDCQLADGLPAEIVLGLPHATIDEACSATAVILVAPDVKEELPVLYLRLRQAALDGGVPFIEIVPQATGFSRYATWTLVHRPGEAASVARALLDAVAGAPPSTDAGGPGGVSAADTTAAAALLGKGPVVVVVGRPSVAESVDATAEAVGVLAELSDVGFLSALRRGNVHGALDMGLAPGVLPGRVSLDAGRRWFTDAWGAVPEARGLDALGIMGAAASNRIQAMVLLGADPVSDFPDRTLARRALAGVGFTVVVDLFLTDAALHADVVLPVSSWGERPGTTTNVEGRVTRLGQKVTGAGTTRPDWMVAVELATRMGADLGFDTLDGITAEIAALAPSHRGLTPDVLARSSSRDGILVPLPAGEAVAAAGDPAVPLPGGDPASAGDVPPLLTFGGVDHAAALRPVDAYSLRLVTRRSLYDGGALVQHSPSLATLAAATRFLANPYDLSRLGIRPGDLVRVTSARASLVLEAVSDAGVPRSSAVVDFNQPVTEVRVETATRNRGS